MANGSGSNLGFKERLWTAAGGKRDMPDAYEYKQIVGRLRSLPRSIPLPVSQFPISIDNRNTILNKLPPDMESR